MEIGKPFNDVSAYLKSMSKSLQDKLFFLDHLPKNELYFFIDFGCADGVLINALYELFADKHRYIGYDISQDMVEFAKTKFVHSTNRVQFSSNWNEVAEQVIHYMGAYKVVIILSSVVHEIYSYANKESDISADWYKILNNANYICVRDMMFSEDLNRETGDILYERVVNNKREIKYLNSFQEHHGSISNMKQFVHYLLKYRWKINWEREVRENYFPISVEEFLKIFELDFNCTYLERFRVPFLEECWKKDFDIQLEDYTHIKCIFELKHL